MYLQSIVSYRRHMCFLIKHTEHELIFHSGATIFKKNELQVVQTAAKSEAKIPNISFYHHRYKNITTLVVQTIPRDNYLIALFNLLRIAIKLSHTTNFHVVTLTLK